MNPTQKCERLFELIAPTIHPRLARSLTVKIKPQSRYTYIAHKNGRGVSLQVNFYPASQNWKQHFEAALGAVMQILDGRTTAVRVAKLTELEASLLNYQRDLQLVESGYYLPKREGR